MSLLHYMQFVRDTNRVAINHGGIVERGRNRSGYYTKFGDGTLQCDRFDLGWPMAPGLGFWREYRWK